MPIDPVKKKQPVDDLDGLLAEIDSPAPAASMSTAPDDLDSLLSEIDRPGVSQPAAPATKQVFDLSGTGKPTVKNVPVSTPRKGGKQLAVAPNSPPAQKDPYSYDYAVQQTNSFSGSKAGAAKGGPTVPKKGGKGLDEVRTPLKPGEVRDARGRAVNLFGEYKETPRTANLQGRTIPIETFGAGRFGQQATASDLTKKQEENFVYDLNKNKYNPPQKYQRQITPDGQQERDEAMRRTRQQRPQLQQQQDATSTILRQIPKKGVAGQVIGGLTRGTVGADINDPNQAPEGLAEVAGRLVGEFGPDVGLILLPGGQLEAGAKLLPRIGNAVLNQATRGTLAEGYKELVSGNLTENPLEATGNILTRGTIPGAVGGVAGELIAPFRGAVNTLGDAAELGARVGGRAVSEGLGNFLPETGANVLQGQSLSEAANNAAPSFAIGALGGIAGSRAPGLPEAPIVRPAQPQMIVDPTDGARMPARIVGDDGSVIDLQQVFGQSQAVRDPGTYGTGRMARQTQMGLDRNTDQLMTTELPPSAGINRGMFGDTQRSYQTSPGMTRADASAYFTQEMPGVRTPSTTRMSRPPVMDAGRQTAPDLQARTGSLDTTRMEAVPPRPMARPTSPDFRSFVGREQTGNIAPDTTQFDAPARYNTTEMAAAPMARPQAQYDPNRVRDTSPLPQQKYSRARADQELRTGELVDRQTTTFEDKPQITDPVEAGNVRAQYNRPEPIADTPYLQNYRKKRAEEKAKARAANRAANQQGGTANTDIGGGTGTQSQVLGKPPRPNENNPADIGTQSQSLTPPPTPSPMARPQPRPTGLDTPGATTARMPQVDRGGILTPDETYFARVRQQDPQLMDEIKAAGVTNQDINDLLKQRNKLSDPSQWTGVSAAKKARMMQALEALPARARELMEQYPKYSEASTADVIKYREETPGDLASAQEQGRLKQYGAGRPVGQAASIKARVATPQGRSARQALLDEAARYNSLPEYIEAVRKGTLTPKEKVAMNKRFNDAGVATVSDPVLRQIYREGQILKEAQNRVEDLSRQLDEAGMGKLKKEPEQAQWYSRREQSLFKQYQRAQADLEKAGKGATVTDKARDLASKLEKDARARISKRASGSIMGSEAQFIALAGDYALVGAAKILRGAANFVDWSAKMLKEFGDKIKPKLRELYNAAKKKVGDFFDFDIKKPGQGGFIQLGGSAQPSPGGRPQAAPKTATGAPPVPPRDKTPLLQAASSYTKASLLSTISGRLGDLSGTLFYNAVRDLIEKPIAGAADKLLSTKTGVRTTASSTPASILKSGAAAITKGAPEAVNTILKRNFSPDDLKRLELEEVFTGTNPISKVFDGFVNTVFRTASAVDKPSYNYALKSAFENRLKVEAANAKAAGKSFDSKQYKDLIERDKAGKPLTQQEAEIINAAKLEAMDATFNKDNAVSTFISGVKDQLWKGGKVDFGAAGKFEINSKPARAGAQIVAFVLDQIAPFVKVASNVAYKGVDLTAGATIRGSAATYRAAKGGLTPKDQAIIAKSIGEGALGTAALLAGILLYKNGMASEKSDKTKDRGKNMAANRPQGSVVIPGTDQAVPLRIFGPLGNLANFGIGLAAAAEKDQESAQLVSDILSRSADIAFDHPLVQSVKESGKTLAQEGGIKRDAARRIGNLVPLGVTELSGVASKAFLEQPALDRLVENPGKDFKTGLKETAQERIPILREKLPAKPTPLGNVNEKSLLQPVNPLRSRTLANRKVVEEADRIGASISGLKRSEDEKTGQYTETTAEFSERGQVYGQILEKNLAGMIDSKAYQTVDEIFKRKPKYLEGVKPEEVKRAMWDLVMTKSRVKDLEEAKDIDPYDIRDQVLDSYFDKPDKEEEEQERKRELKREASKMAIKR